MEIVQSHRGSDRRIVIGEPGRSRLHHRALGRRQVVPAALYQPPGAGERRHDLVRGSSGLSLQTEREDHRGPERRVEQILAPIGMVFQAFNLYPHLTAIGNVIEAPVHVLRQPVEQARSHGMEVPGISQGPVGGRAGVGMSRRVLMRCIILPQSVRIIFPRSATFSSPSSRTPCWSR